MAYRRLSSLIMVLRLWLVPCRTCSGSGTLPAGRSYIGHMSLQFLSRKPRSSILLSRRIVGNAWRHVFVSLRTLLLIMLAICPICGKVHYRECCEYLLARNSLRLTLDRIVSQTLLVMGATLSPSLSGLLPQPHQINAIVAEVVSEMQRYAHLAPSLRLAANIISDAEDRRRQNLRSPSMQYLKMG